MVEYYEKKRVDRKNIYATFWLSGVPASSSANSNDDAMDVDGAEKQEALQNRVMLVNEGGLERESIVHDGLSLKS